MATLVTVTYESGETVETKVKPLHMSRAEQAVKGGIADNAYTIMLRASWEALGRPSLNFTTWMDTVDDFTSADPESPAPSPEEPQPDA